GAQRRSGHALRGGQPARSGHQVQLRDGAGRIGPSGQSEADLPRASDLQLQQPGLCADSEGSPADGYVGSANKPKSEIAGQTEACVTRSRTRDVVIRGPLIKRQLPMLV